MSLAATLLALLTSSLSLSSPFSGDVPVGFSKGGEWGLLPTGGPDPAKKALWASKPGATATWNPGIASEAPVRVAFYVVSGRDNEPSARFEICHNGRADVRMVDTRGTSRWVDLGIFEFGGSGQEYVTVAKVTPNTVLRVAALRFEVLDPNDTSYVWQTLILDDLTSGSSAGLARFVAFRDLKNHWAAEDAGSLVGEGVLPNPGPDFEPGRPIARGEVVTALEKLTGLEFGDRQSKETLTHQQTLDLVARAAKQSGRNLEWAGATDIPSREFATQLGVLTGDADPAFSGPDPVTRGEAAVVLGRFSSAIIQGGPPATTKWELTFSDEFSGDTVDATRWKIYDNDTYGKILSSRWKDNVEVKGGRLRLITKKETRGGKDWTSGFMATKTFRQQYGYFEARLKLAPATGLNQAFWLRPEGKIDQEDHFEIDVVEAHYPSTVNMSLHQHDVRSISKTMRTPLDLAKGFHVYGVDWSPREIVYYMDGKVVDRKANTKANRECIVMLSTAVAPWAGPIRDEMNGKAMEVDWVRIYKRK